MKERVLLICEELEKNLKLNYKEIVNGFIESAADIKKIDTFWLWPLTTFIYRNGIKNLKTSARGMKELTKHFTGEFCIRYFLEEYEGKFFKEYLDKWVLDKNEHVRRLVSEGTRPNLPWGIKVDYLNNNLEQNIRLLNQLRKDESLYVRKSVANHLNDISRLDPDLMLKTLESWKKPTKEEKWIIKHASRTLLKAGHPKVLKLNGFSINPKVELSQKKVSKKKIKEGDSFDLSFKLKNLSSKPLKLSVDYIIYYPKKNGDLSPKTFKLKDIVLDDFVELKKKVSFKKVTTRKHYPGRHKIEIKVSNKKFNFLSFELL